MAIPIKYLRPLLRLGFHVASIAVRAWVRRRNRRARSRPGRRTRP